MEKNICPICGEPIEDYKSAYPLTDASICLECAEDLRFLFPFIIFQKGERKRMDFSLIPHLAQLNKREIAILNKHILSSYDSFIIDEMHLLSLKKFRSLLDRADALENDIRFQFDDYTNICTVDALRPLPDFKAQEIGIQNLRKWKNCIGISGLIKAGSFKDGDMVTILHKGEKIEADIMLLDFEYHGAPNEFSSNDFRASVSCEKLKNQSSQPFVRAGHTVVMIFNSKASKIQVGDLIVSD